MSTVANTHTVVEYNSGVTKALSGQRLSTHSWKTTKVGDTEYKRPSVCVSIPLVTSAEIAENVTALIPVIASFLQDTQDKMIRESLNVGKHGEYVHVTQESISVGAMIEWLESSNESGRLTKEVVAEWFDAEIAETLMVELAVKLGVSEECTQADSDKIEAIVGEFKNKISALAGGKTVYPVGIAKQLKKAVELVGNSDDVLKGRFLVRLDKMMLEVKENDLLGAL